MISELVFEQIEGNFWFAAYGPFRVIMMKDTGYINATKLCSSGGKEYKEWIKNKSSKELMHALEDNMALQNTHGSLENSDSTLADANLGITPLASPACIFVKTANNTPTEQLKSGTYCHPDLIPHIACWVSADFAMKVSKVVNGYITLEYKNKLDAMELQLEQATELREAATLDAYRAQQQVEQKDQQVQQKDQQLQQKDLELQAKEQRHQVWSSSHAFSMLRTNEPAANYHTMQLDANAAI